MIVLLGAANQVTEFIEQEVEPVLANYKVRTSKAELKI